MWNTCGESGWSYTVRLNNICGYYNGATFVNSSSLNLALPSTLDGRDRTTYRVIVPSTTLNTTHILTTPPYPNSSYPYNAAYISEVDTSFRNEIGQAKSQKVAKTQSVTCTYSTQKTGLYEGATVSLAGRLHGMIDGYYYNGTFYLDTFAVVATFHFE